MNKECKEYVLQIIASLCLCDHMGDVGGDIDKMLKDIDFDAGEWESASDLLDVLARHGVTTLYGTTLSKPDEFGGEGVA